MNLGCRVFGQGKEMKAKVETRGIPKVQQWQGMYACRAYMEI